MIQQEQGESADQACARATLGPLLMSAVTIRDYSRVSADLDLTILVDALEEQMVLLHRGDLQRPEEMLLAQAHTMDAIFNRLMGLGICSDSMSKLDTYMKLGLRAQSQCRANVEVLASIKSPRTHLTQTNIAHNQQVNNGIAQSKLLEETDGERLDFGKAATPIRSDQTLETVGKKHRSKNA